MAFKTHKEDSQNKVLKSLQESIKEVENLIRQNNEVFNLSDHEDLIDFTIYQDIALKARFDFLLKEYKKELVKRK